MGRELKRVPLDFNYPLNEVWEGYAPTIEKIKSIKGIFKKAPYLKDCKSSWDICSKCDEIINCCSESAEHCIWYNKDNKREWYKEVPEGEGYQLWETTSEGSPTSPVFKTLDDLCEWCEDNATTFADYKATKEEWRRMLQSGLVSHKEVNVEFI